MDFGDSKEQAEIKAKVLATIREKLKEYFESEDAPEYLRGAELLTISIKTQPLTKEQYDGIGITFGFTREIEGYAAILMWATDVGRQSLAESIQEANLARQVSDRTH